MENIETVIFYSIDKAIKSYRQYAQKKIKEAGFSVTIDQWLILKNLQENPQTNQQELGRKVFKDNASVTRILEILVKSKLVKRETSEEDRRRNYLSVTEEGLELLQQVQPIILKNRATAVKGINLQELEYLRKNLQKIIENVSE